MKHLWWLFRPIASVKTPLSRRQGRLRADNYDGRFSYNRGGSVRLDTQRAELSGCCQFLLCPELSTAAVGRRLHDERPIAAVGNSHALRVVQSF